MNRLLASFGWILLLLPFISVAGTKTLVNNISNYISTEKRHVSNFNGISSSGSYDVYIKMGAVESLEIEGDSDLIKNIETKVEGGILKIQNSKTSSGWGWNNPRTKIYITAKSLNHLTLSGSGKMVVSNAIKSDKLNTSVSGSGSIRLELATKIYNASVSGSGQINASGFTQNANISVSGSGGFDGKNLKTNTSAISVSGSGNAYICAEDRLNAHLSGSGNITYSGNAQVSQVKSGSGKITKD